jgi:hypothetical protein
MYSEAAQYNVKDLSAGVGADADGSDESESGFMALVFAFAAPQAIFVIVSGKIATQILNIATRANTAGQSFATFASLRPFGSGGEEEVGHATARTCVHPRVVRLLTGDDDFYSCHTTPWW